MATFSKNWATLLLFVQLGFLATISNATTQRLSEERDSNVKPLSSIANEYSSLSDVALKYRWLTARSLNPFKKLGESIKKFILKKILASWHTRHPTKKCYNVVGCFHHHDNMSLQIGGPQSPEEVDTTFYFFKNGSTSDLQDLLNETEKTVLPEKTYSLDNWTRDDVSKCLDLDKPLMVVTHGLTGSKRTPWMLPLVEALLENVNCTVLVVDWEKGANGTYPDAGINTPMAGALISVFLQNIVNFTEGKIGPDNITLIGFSMGAQVMGFAGRHFKNSTNTTIWRIAGLDPAGWLYEHTNYTLSKNDARYVDVIHTNAGSMIKFRIGLSHSVGHVDFYPNGGSVQTGCKSKPSTFYSDYLDVITCSHYKATAYFIESLKNHSCTFTSYGCKNWNDFAEGDCTRRIPPVQKGLMGFYSYRVNVTGDQFLYTNSDPPYCRGNDTTKPKPPKKPSFWKKIFRWWNWG